MIRLHYTDGGIARTFDLAAAELADLGPILRKFSKLVRTEVAQTFSQQGPGWAPLAGSTQKAREGTAEDTALAARLRGQQGLRTKLKGDLRRAMRRLGTGKGKEATVEARYEVLREFERLVGGGRTDYSLLSSRKAKSLKERIARAESTAQEQQGKLLGRLAGSIKAEVKGGTLEIRSTIPWAGIHNEGGTAGRGAQIPARTFLEWTPERLEKLAGIASAHMAEKLK